MENLPPPIYQFGEFRIDASKRLLQRSDGSVVPLTPRVFETLLYLVEHSGKVLDRERLMAAVWPDTFVEENNLTQNISTLRRVLGEGPGTHRFIVTVPGHGYRFVAEVRKGEEKTGAPIETVPNEAAPAVLKEVPEPPLAPERLLIDPPVRQRRTLLLISAVVLLAFGLALFFVWKSRTQNPPEARGDSVPPLSEKSIAVLPFANLSGDPENAYFAEGVKDEILIRLSKIATLKVISRTSTLKFKSAPDNVREIAHQLGVVNILEGSVQRSGDAVRVTVQLINAPNDTQLWAESYDRKLTDMFQVETEIAQSIATALAATLTGSEKRALENKPDANVEAHQNYLKGRYFWNKRTVEGHKQAVEYLIRAIDLAPAYAQAYTGLADALLFLGDSGAMERKEAVTKGAAALKKALQLDETLAEPHASLGLLAMNSSLDWSQAEREFQRAIQLNPNYATAHQWYGEFLVYMGRFDESIAEMKRAQELDPLSLIIGTDLAKVYMMARRYDQAIDQYKRALELDPEFPEAHGLLALTYSLKGEHEMAFEELGKIKGLDHNPRYLSWLGYAYGAAGRKDDAGRVLDRLRELSSQTHVSPYWMAAVYAGLGDKDETFQWFEKLFADPASGGAITLKVSPLFDDLRSDPRFADLLRRAHFAP